MAQMKITAAAVSLAVALTASTPALAQRNRSIESVNQPVVQRVDYVIDLNTNGDRVSESELYRLDDWFQGLQLGYGDRVSVDTASYGSDRLRQDVASVAAEYGILLSPGAPITAGGIPSGAARVVVSRSEAFVPGCPNWSDSGQVGDLISTSPNYGCASNSNLAAMIADPNDLVLGQSDSGNRRAPTAAKAIKHYRDATPTGAKGLDKNVLKGGK